jgi:hypothetical protein
VDLPFSLYKIDFSSERLFANSTNCPIKIP